MINVAATVRADVDFQVGSANESVTVNATALAVQTDTSEVSSLITGEQVLQLATHGRSMMSLVTAGTGVTNTLPSFNGVKAPRAAAPKSTSTACDGTTTIG